jgi:hypothetical protein
LREFPNARIWAVGEEAKKMLDRLQDEFDERIVQKKQVPHGMRLKGGFCKGTEIVSTLEDVIIPIAHGLVEDPGPCRPFDSKSVLKIESFAKMARKKKKRKKKNKKKKKSNNFDIENKKKKKSNNFDITDMDDIDEPIAKSLFGMANKIKGAASKTPQSKWAGVWWREHADKWSAQITIKGKMYHIGYYDDDFEAGVMYHRVKAKYVDRGGGSKLVIDITDMDDIDEPIAKSFGMANKIKGAASKTPQSKWVGVSWYECRGKWRAEITIKGKKYHLGLYDDDYKAGVMYHRVKAKYVDGNTADAVII